MTGEEIDDADLDKRLKPLRRDERYQRRVTEFLDWFEEHFVPPREGSRPWVLRVLAFGLIYLFIECCVDVGRFLVSQGLVVHVTLNTAVVAACASYCGVNAMRPGAPRLGPWIALLLIAVVFTADTLVGSAVFTELKWVAVVAAVLSVTARDPAASAFYAALLVGHPLIACIMRAEAAMPDAGATAAAGVYVLLHFIPEALFAARGLGNVRPLLFSLAAQALIASAVYADLAAPFEEPLFYFAVRVVPLALLVGFAVPMVRPAVNTAVNFDALGRLDWNVRYARFHIGTAGGLGEDGRPRGHLTINKSFDLAGLAVELHRKLCEDSRDRARVAELHGAPPPIVKAPRRNLTECEVCETRFSVNLYDNCDHLWVVCDNCRSVKFGNACPICEARLA